MKISEHIRQRRKFLKMKQSELAVHLNVTVAQISAIESGKSNITVDKLIKIASILRCEPSLLINDADCPEFMDSESIVAELVSMYYNGSHQEIIELVEQNTSDNAYLNRTFYTSLLVWKAKALLELQRRDECIELCNHLINDIGIIRQHIVCHVHLTLGAALNRNGDYQESLKHLTIARDIAFSANRLLFINARKEILYHIGYTYMNMGNTQMSIQSLRQLASEIDSTMMFDVRLKARGYFLASSHYYYAGNLRQAYRMAKKSYDLFSLLDDVHNVSSIACNIAQMCRKLGMWGQAERYFSECLTLIKVSPNKVSDKVKREMYKAGYDF